MEALAAPAAAAVAAVPERRESSFMRKLKGDSEAKNNNDDDGKPNITKAIQMLREARTKLQDQNTWGEPANIKKKKCLG